MISEERWNDGTAVEGAWPAADGTLLPGGPPLQGRYGAEWQRALFTAEDILHSDPEYRFVEQVAGATGALTVRDLLNMDAVDRVVAKANEAGWRAAQMLERLQGQWDVFESFDAVMVDFALDAEGATFVRDEVVRRGLELVTARLTQDMVKAREGYGATMGRIAVTGAVEVGVGAEDVMDFHQRVGAMVDAGRWYFEPVPGEFGVMHRRFVEEMASGHFAVAAHRWLVQSDPRLVPTLMRLVRGASAASERYRRLLERRGTADIDQPPEDAPAAIDAYLFLMAVLDMSWQVVMELRNEPGLMYTNPDSPGQVVIREAAERQELGLTPKRLWYRWLVQVLERLGAPRRRETLAEAVDRRVIKLGADPIVDEEGGVVPEYPFHKLHDLANRYSASPTWRAKIDQRFDAQLRVAENAIADGGRTLDDEWQQYTKWINASPERKQVLFALTRALEKLLDSLQGGDGYSSMPSMESGTPTLADSDEEEETGVKRSRAPAPIGGELSPKMPRRGRARQPFVSAPAREMDALIGALHETIEEFERLQETHAEMRGGIEAVVTEALRGVGGPRGGGVDPEWILQPRFTGRITKSPALVAAINMAINEIREELPRLAPRGITDPAIVHRGLATTPFLSQMYAKLVAYHMQQAASLFPRSMMLDKTYERGRKERIGVLYQMSSWLWGSPPYDTGRALEAARGRSRGGLRMGGARVATLPPAIRPTDSRYRAAAAAAAAAPTPPKKRQRVAGGGDIPVAPISGGVREVLDVAGHVVRNWDEEYIRRRVLDHVRSSAVGL